MKIEDYIKLYELTERTPRTQGVDDWIPIFVQDRDMGEFTYYTNDDATHVVIEDRRAKEWMVVHEIPSRIKSEWFHTDTNYEPGARVFW